MTKKTVALAFISSLMSLHAAANIQCGGTPAESGYATPGTVTRVITYADGSVNVWSTWRNENTYICNVKTARLGVDPLVCAIWVSKIEAARAINAPVVMHYYTNTMTCANIPTYDNAPAPAFVGY